MGMYICYIFVKEKETTNNCFTWMCVGRGIGNACFYIKLCLGVWVNFSLNLGVATVIP